MQTHTHSLEKLLAQLPLLSKAQCESLVESANISVAAKPITPADERQVKALLLKQNL
jgi:16S rRNA U516 pseudouridylate synthase RsuA-like enzyme